MHCRWGSELRAAGGTVITSAWEARRGAPGRGRRGERNRVCLWGAGRLLGGESRTALAASGDDSRLLPPPCPPPQRARVGVQTAGGAGVGSFPRTQSLAALASAPPPSAQPRVLL